jgi:adenine-specific DNA-methyltransferase
VRQAFFSRPTFPEIYTVREKLISVDMSAAVASLRVAFDDRGLFHNHSAWSFVPWHSLQGVRNNSLKKAARYRGETRHRPDLPKREELEAISRRFSVKYLLGVMNSAPARDFLRANRRSNIHLYPDDWKQLPIPDVAASEQKPIIALVDQILKAKRANPGADLTALEAALDNHVTALYGLRPKKAGIEETARAAVQGGRGR